jgi:pepF/M3 family oligoendopeptidase
MATVVELPRWDVSQIFPELDSPEFDAAFSGAVTDIAALADFMDAHGVERREGLSVDAGTVRVFEDLIDRYNALQESVGTLGSYIHSFVATDSRNATAQAKRSMLRQYTVRLSQLSTRITAWLGSLDVETLIESSPVAAAHAFLLRQETIESSHLMAPDLEDLAAEMSPVSSSAWARLYTDITSQLTVPFDAGQGRESVPMTVIRNYAFDPDRSVRRRAYEAELGAWQGVETPLAAALNSIKGQTNLIGERRGWGTPLEIAVHNNHIDMQTLEAMMSAARAAFPQFRRYFHAKARAIGVERLAWYDLFAPVGTVETEWDWDAGTRFLVEQFSAYSDRLAAFAQRAFDERWIDAAPRPGKVGGAFCMWIKDDQSRVLANYQPSYDGVSTIAHELGHAYHNLCKAPRTPLQRSTPMTLAETASTFCETIIRDPAMSRVSAGEALGILDAYIQGVAQVVVDITSRFLFEQRVLERRKERELAPEEFCELMLETQRETYGDGLDGTQLHPYMWAAKGHYYGSTFYNFPYMFGQLFGTGLYARYKTDPDAFRGGYDDLLSSTGMEDAATLAARFGIDTRSTDFWASSLQLVSADIDRFEKLVDAAH